jgi:hypothetical protein
MRINNFAAAVLVALSLAAWPSSAKSQGLSNYNGTGSTTHTASTTAYTTGELFAHNSSGNAAASQIAITTTQTGLGLIDHFIMQSSGTNKPPSITVWLFSSPPLTTGLADYSAYVAPYAADFTGGIVIGSFTCANWNATNDGTAVYWSECSSSNLVYGPLPFRAASAQTYIYALEEIGGSYTPLSAEVHTYILSTLRDN